MGFRPRNSATLLLSLLGLGSILGVDGSWLFGAMQERENDYRRALQPRQFVQCSAGSKACGVLGCVASRRCCNPDAGWGCLTGNACYTANGFVDCYSTTMVMPTVSRKCYDFTASGCTLGQACFRCGSTSAFCATEVLASGTETWLVCDTKSAVSTVTASAAAAESTLSDDPSVTVQTDRSRSSTGNWPTRTGTTMVPYPTETTTPEKKLGGGAIAGIAIAGLAGIAIVGALIFFLCIKKKSRNDAPTVQPQYVQPPPTQMPYQQQPLYSPPPQQQPQYMAQTPYSPLPGYQGQMAHNSYSSEGQSMVPPISSPVYPEQPKQPVTLPAELN
ncbi:hypothetical protein HOY82DRAFT_480799 [Tuber indicum]|nr:hypothetical protein HOY82DRAFT_480799 [Tuber indicum]